MPTPRIYRAEGLAPSVAISDDGVLLATLKQVMVGWRLVSTEMRDAVGAATANIRVDQGPEGWTCSGVTFKKPMIFPDPVATACGLIAALYKAHTLQDRETVVLHAGGVRIGEGLVLLTGHYRSGKTVFTAACAAAGLQVYSDDIVPLDTETLLACAVGLGIRLRLPLPDNLAESTRAFIARHRIAASDRYAYIRPPLDRLARHGERVPVCGVVSLRRTDDGAANLKRLPSGNALSETIKRNFARETLAGKIVDTLDAVTARVPCLALSYSRAEDAVMVLRKAFEQALPEDIEQLPSQPSVSSERSTATLPVQACLTRAPGVSTRERGDQAFLTNAAESMIFNLNATGAAVWHALAQPMTFGELTGLFSVAFPDRDPADLALDISHLVRRLAKAGLVSVRETHTQG